MTTPHPYYDSEKKKKFERKYMWYLTYAVIIIMGCIIVLGIKKVIEYENVNLIEVWVNYEAITDQDKVILYKTHDPSDSIVFRIPCTNNPFKGVECIEKLEYRLP